MTISDHWHPYVKDLAWLLEGHYICQEFALADYWCADSDQRLMALAANPQPLINKVAACKSHFLGSYFETLFSFAIEHFSHLTMLAEHFQIQHQGRTLGEVDALLADPQGQLWQFEIAVKFYLQRDDLAPHQWIGPNKKDSLAIKLARAQDHQLTLLQSPEGRQAIRPWLTHEEQEVNAELLIFGRLFYELNGPYQWQQRLTQCPVQGEVCGWLRLENLSLAEEKYNFAKLLAKPHWLALGDRSEAVPLANLAALLEDRFNLDERPVNIFCWHQDDPQCLANLFVVPNDW